MLILSRLLLVDIRRGVFAQFKKGEVLTNTFNMIHLQTDKRFVFERFTTKHTLQENLTRADIHYTLDKVLDDFYLQLDVVR